MKIFKRIVALLLLSSMLLSSVACGDKSATGEQSGEKAKTSGLIDSYSDVNLSRNPWIKEEVIQLYEEGYDFDKDAYLKKAEEANGKPEKEMALYKELQGLPMRKDFKYVEPSDYETIMKNTDKSLGNLEVDYGTINDKVKGAWYGKISGIAMGSPFEAWNYADIKKYCEKADMWPINDYIPDNSRAIEEDNLKPNAPYLCKGKFALMPSDDDLRFVSSNIMSLNAYGSKINTWDIGSGWLYGLPFRLLCTAERIAYLNFASLDDRYMFGKPKNFREVIKSTATYMNPYREYIGAQIRADAFGYAAPGRPRDAAKMAFEDAALSHTKNGIYGEMFFAAMVSAAFVETDVNKLIDRALAEIPKNTRFYEAIVDAKNMAKTAKSEEELVTMVNEKYSTYNNIHVIPNAVACVASIVYTKGDVNKAIPFTIHFGMDTDCNAATVGSVLGAMHGFTKIDAKYTSVFNDTFKSDLANFPTSIEEIVTYTISVQDKIMGELKG